MGESWIQSFHYDQKWLDQVNRNVDRILASIREDEYMPLVKGKKAKSRKGFSENVKREMHEGKPQKQAVAIAYSEARRGKRKKK